MWGSRVEAETQRNYQLTKAHRSERDLDVISSMIARVRVAIYAWMEQLISDRAAEDVGLIWVTRASLLATHGIYDLPRIVRFFASARASLSGHIRLIRVLDVRDRRHSD